MPQGGINEPAQPQPVAPVVIKNEQAGPSAVKMPSGQNAKVFLTGILMLLLVAGIGVGVFLAKNRTQLNSQAAAANVVLGFKPDQINTTLNGTFETTVTIDSKDQNVTGAELHIIYDPQLFILESFDKGTFLPNSVGQSEINNGSANITLIPNLSDLSPGKGQGDLAKLKFKVIRTQEQPAEITVDKTKTQISAEGQDTNALGTTQKAVITFGTQTSPSPNASTTASASPASSGSPAASASPIASASPAASMPGGISSPSPSASTALLSPSPSASAQIQSKKDFNGDGKVNTVDLSFMYSAWGIVKIENNRKADLNGDGVVNGIDYSLFLPGFSP